MLTGGRYYGGVVGITIISMLSCTPLKVKENYLMERSEDLSKWLKCKLVSVFVTFFVRR